MTLSTASRLLSKASLLSAVAALALASSSCNSWIYDDEGDCTAHYNLSFRFTKNVLNTDAFGSQVTNVNVALYDRQGNMVLRKSQSRAVTPDNNYKMEIEVLPGTYDIIAWCEGESPVAGASSFILDGQQTGDAITASGAHLQLETAAGTPYYDKDLNPLFYGSLTGVKFDKEAYGVVDVATIDLIKDTNHITVMLQNQDGNPLDPSQLQFELQAQNNVLDWKNALTGSTSFVYTPWSIEGLVADMTPASKATVADSNLPSGAKAEFTTGRLMADREQLLIVTEKSSGAEILRFPLIEYLMMVRSNYDKATSAQDYLDRVDDYSLLFFVDESYTWIKSRIYINGWRVVPKQDSHL